MIVDIGTWLRGLGLERYEEAFRDAAIDVSVLPDLTDDHLKELGIPLGHRIQLIKAIATPGAAEEPRMGASHLPRTSEAERRQLTVLFCDLVGSTALSARLDPEDMREVIRAYQDTCAEVVARFEGFVAKFMGDGVLAYFGYPRAHEDEAERAVRAGLALVDAVVQLEAPDGSSLAARVGIASGLVVVGDIVGEHASEERMVVGDTPNLAARLQGVARPGQVVIAEATRRLIGSGFDLADLGPQTLKGLAEPTPAFAVSGERALASRFEAQRQILPMVGRDHELALLLERWAQAKAGKGQGVLLVGEAGIGKSRITRALLDAIAEEPHIRIRYQCSPYHTDSALWPVIQQLGRAAEITAADPAEAKLDKLEALLHQAGDVSAAPLLADLLGLDASRYRALDLTPHVQRARTLEALVAQLLGLAAWQPVLVVFEDAHWLDPTTFELIAQSLEQIAGARVLMQLTSRPDNPPALAVHPHMTWLTLNRLGRAGGEAIIERLRGETDLASDTIAAIVERTDGVPLFVEELTKAVLETGETTVPASLHDSMMARLDRIPEAKEVAQIAACIGRAFDYPLLAAVAGKTEPELRSSLDTLATAELVFRRGTPPDAAYTFKHALVQGAAYESLLRTRRQRLHAEIAHWLERRSPDVAAELLAHHFTQAGLNEDAVHHLQQAGEHAASRSANAEALAHFKQALQLLDAVADDDKRSRTELELQIALGQSLKAAVGFTVPEIRTVLNRARELADRLGDSRRLIHALRGLCSFHEVAADLDEARVLADQMVVRIKESSDPVSATVAYRSRGGILYLQGDFVAARADLERAFCQYDPRHHSEHVRSSALDAGVQTLNYLAMTLWILGYPDQAARVADKSIGLAREIDHPFSTVLTLYHVSILLEHCGKWSAVEGLCEELAKLSVEYGFPTLRVSVSIHKGIVSAGRGQLAAGIEGLKTGLEQRRRLGAVPFETWYVIRMADALNLNHEPREGLDQLPRAFEIVGKGERVHEAELLRVAGELHLSLGDAEPEGEAQLVKAIDLARRQQAKSWELRAATSLARHWLALGERQKARDLLAPVYGWFTEGFDTVDLRNARALLDELG